MTLFKLSNTLKTLILALFVFGLSSQTFAANVGKMTKEELKNIMDKDNVTILDVRKGRDWSSSEFKIKGAVRVDLKNIVTDAKQFPKDQTLVLYCA